MHTENSNRFSWQDYVLCAGLWTVLALLDAGQTYVSQLVIDRPVPWGLVLRRAFEEWYLWGALSIGVLWLARRLRYGHNRGARWFLLHTAGSLVVSVIYVALYAWLLRGQRSIDGTIFTFSGVFQKVIVHYFVINMTMYWMIVLAHHGWHYYRRYRERELHAAALQQQLVQARLDALRMQLNPHFLFNTLHTISALIHANPEGADRMIARLSELLRTTLEQSHVPEVPLRQELAFLDGYLEIEQTRFQDRLTMEKRIEPGLDEALVPCLILQPLVENAIRHGIEPREDMGRVCIQARRQNDRLELSVSDNGSGLPEEETAPRKEGIGLSNTRSRLRHLYGDEQSFDLIAVPGGGLEARLVLPYRTHSVAELDPHAR